MAYSKHTWVDGEIIDKDKLNNIENGIEGIELTPGPKGDPGEKGETGDQGPKGETGAQGPAGKDAKAIKSIVINTDASDKVTGGTLTYTDDSTVNITVNKAGA